MKLRVTWVLAVGMGALSVVGCTDKKTAVRELAVQTEANADVVAGKIITSAQAVAWTKSFQAAHPDETWGGLFEAHVFTKLLAQDGCRGIRIYNGINDKGKNAFVMVGVNGEGDMTSGLLADMSAPCPPNTYDSPLVSVPAEQLLPPVLPAGGMIPLSLATTMTTSYQAAHPGGMRAGLFSADYFHQLLAQKGCIGLRVYKGLKDEGEECYVVVGVNAEGADMTQGLILDESKPCPTFCSDGSPLLLH